MVYDIGLAILAPGAVSAAAVVGLKELRPGMDSMDSCDVFQLHQLQFLLTGLRPSRVFYFILLKVSASNHGTVLVTVTLLYPLVSQVQDPLANLRLNWGGRLACFISPYVFLLKAQWCWLNSRIGHVVSLALLDTV